MTAATREELVELPTGEQVLLRPIRPTDAPFVQDLVHRMSPQDVRMRFFAPLRELSPVLLHRLTNPDPAREAAIVVHAAGSADILAVGRLSAEPGASETEYALAVRTDLKGHGIGYMLMARLIEIARQRGYRAIFGLVLRENEPMLHMCREYGFLQSDVPEDPAAVRVTLALAQSPRSSA
jgi:acetyltransferase